MLKNALFQRRKGSESSRCPEEIIANKPVQGFKIQPFSTGGKEIYPSTQPAVSSLRVVCKNSTYMHKPIYISLLAVFLTALATNPIKAQQFFFSTEKPAACGSTDGIITIVPTRGVPPFTYAWDNGSTELSLRNIPKGVYTATLTDATGATVVHTCYLNSHELDIVESFSAPAGGCNPNSGRISIEAVSGTAPYTYTWSNGQTTAENIGLAAGTYTVTIQDATGCTAIQGFTVESLPFTPYMHGYISAVDQPDCVNLANGVLDAIVDSYQQFPPFTYQWSTGATTAQISGLTTGNYSVTITDIVGCATAASFQLQNKLNTTGNTICSGNTTGSATALLVNGASPVTYLWSNGQNGPAITNLGAGVYNVSATDANGCSSVNQAYIAAPTLYLQDYSSKCYSGNNGRGYVQVNNDQATSYLWDDGDTNPWNNTLSPGLHHVTVTTALGCTLQGTLNIAQPSYSPLVIQATATPADCSQNLGGDLNVTISGGVPPYSFYAYGPSGFLTSDVNSLHNIQSGEYYMQVSALNYSCYTNASVTVHDNSGFEPKLITQQLDCTTGTGSAAVVGVTNPAVQYEWAHGPTTPAVFDLTEGSYAVTVSDGASCNRFYNFQLYPEDTLQGGLCFAEARGRLINDQGVPGCNGTLGMPYQAIRNLTSGALIFTDLNGSYRAGIASGLTDLTPIQFDPADIACPAGAHQSITGTANTIFSGLDFHFLSNSTLDNRLYQRPLRTAQPGYPYSLRMLVCNDGSSTAPGTLDLDYGNILGSISGNMFTQHPGTFVLNNETSGTPNNSAVFTFPSITPGTCEMMQLDLLVPTSTPLQTEFITDGLVSPNSGDPTPGNNRSTLYNTVVGSFDPNAVYSFPARNGNPKDGGEIIRYEDNTIVYQIYFQNTGNAPADLVTIRDSVDEHLDIASIRNITASHDMKISTDQDGKLLSFRFENIALPDSTSDYAGSIGYVQYQIDLKPNVAPGTVIKKQPAIYFDFNSPVITNQNNLEVVNSSRVSQMIQGNEIILFPNPADDRAGLYCDGPSELRVVNSIGELVNVYHLEGGLQQINTAALPNGVYLVQMDSAGKLRSGKLVVSH